MLTSAAARFRKRPVPTVPFHRATNTGSNTSGASATVNVTIPATAQVDDYMYFVVSRWGTAKAVVTPPTGGWTMIMDLPYQNLIRVTVYEKKVVAGEPGASRSVTLAGNGAIAAAIAVYGGTSGMSVHYHPGRSVYTAPKRIPAQYPGPYDLTVCFSAHRPFSSTTTTAALVTAGVSGFTERANFQAQVPLGVPTGLYVADGTLAQGVNGSLTHTVDNYMTAGFMCLAPIGYPKTHQIPSQLAGKPVIVYGESYECLVSDGVGLGHSSEQIHSDRLKWALANPLQSNNMADAGTLSLNICSFAYSTYTATTYAGDLDTEYRVIQAGTWSAVANKNCLIVSDLIGNDALQDHDTGSGGSPAKARAGMQNAVDALIRLWMSSSIVQNTDASITFTGTWGNVNDTAVQKFSGGSAYASVNTGSTFKVTTTATDIDIIIHAIDNTNYPTYDGATYSVTIDGVPHPTHPTGTTSDQTKKPSHDPGQVTVQKAIPCRNMAPGTKEIVVTHTGANGTTVLILDCYLVQANATPPWILTNKVTLQRADTLVALGATQAEVDHYNGLLETVCSNPDFKGRVIVYDPTKSGRWNNVTMIQDNDDLHLAELGDAMYYHEIMQELRARIP